MQSKTPVPGSLPMSAGRQSDSAVVQSGLVESAAATQESLEAADPPVGQQPAAIGAVDMQGTTLGEYGMTGRAAVANLPAADSAATLRAPVTVQHVVASGLYDLD